MVAPYALEAISARIASIGQAVVRGPSFTALGKRPAFTPAHHVERETGMTAGIGGSALGSPMICGKRKSRFQEVCSFGITSYQVSTRQSSQVLASKYMPLGCKP